MAIDKHARPTGYALENPDPVPAHLRGSANAASGPGGRVRPDSGGRDLPLRLALIQLGIVTTAQLADAETALGLAARQVAEEPGRDSA